MRRAQSQRSRARQATKGEAALYREARQFLRAAAKELEGLVERSSALRGRLAQTEAYRKVDGTDEAGNEPIWDIAATLLVVLEEALDDIIITLREDEKRQQRT